MRIRFPDLPARYAAGRGGVGPGRGLGSRPSPGPVRVARGVVRPRAAVVRVARVPSRVRIILRCPSLGSVPVNPCSHGHTYSIHIV